MVCILQVPENMIQVEMLLSKYMVNSNKRADIVIEKYTQSEKELTPLAIVECKAPEIMLGDAAIRQVCEYADLLGAEYIFITNGTEFLSARYDQNQNQYIDLEQMPSYREMLKGGGDVLIPPVEKKRFCFEELEKNKDYYCGYEFNNNTPENMRAFLTNLWECFLDTSHELPAKKYRLFSVIEDYGIRYLSCGNASGGNYQGAYRSFLVECSGNVKFMNLGFFDYGTSTILTVSIDQENRKPHNALQYSINQNLVNVGNLYHFFHSGRIAVGNIGSGKAAELKQLLKEEYPYIIKNNQINLGIIHNQQLLYLDMPEVMELVENLLSYAIIRDKYRNEVKKRVM